MNPPVATETAPFWARLSAYGDRAALVTETGTLSYADLGRRVADLAARLGTTRRLVVVQGANTVDTVVAYLAGLTGGHATVLVPDADTVAAYDPDVVIRSGALDVRREGTAHDLHPDLALLLPTSGSTGSPKLVRLSHANLTANASAIASYLQIRSTDVAPTTLPLHYCYGLSVINSHLSVGASLLLTDRSVSEVSFWADFRAAGCTTLAGVPYTFDLLDRAGFSEMELPTLRYVTQAGGRLAPERVHRFAELGQQRGFDLFVMYGQTEATARMAYLPPDLALSCAGAIGVPVPGGSFRLAPDGELVYRGDNVMLGYATTPADLARGRDLHELHTGDLGRRRPDGLYEVIGRKSRFAKVFGLRIDLERVEQKLSEDGLLGHCCDGGDKVLVAVDVSAAAAPTDLADRAAVAAGLPVSSIEVLALTEIPRLASGKVDYRGIVAARGDFPRYPVKPATGEALEAIFARILRRDVTPDDSFVSLRGDSLSYVELSIRVEAALGNLPADWPTLSIRELETRRGTRRRGRVIEANVLLRALAIVAIVASHADLFMLMGGAHILLGIAGFNFARFFLTDVPRAERVRHLACSIVKVAVPAAAWCALAMTWDDEVTWRNVALVNGIAGPASWDPSWRYWFVEAIVYTLAGVAVLMSLPWVDRLERRWQFALPMALAVVALLTRYDLVELRGGDHIHRAHAMFWLFALGWAAVRARHWRHRLLVSAVLVVSVPGLFEDDARTLVVIGGMLLLIWLRSVRVPVALATPIGTLASASLYIYLCHWQIYPALEDAGHHLLATVASLAAGTALWWAVGRVGENLRWFTQRRYATSDPGESHVRARRAAARPRRDDQPAYVPA